MKEMPLPFTVSAMMTFGLPLTASTFSMVSARASMSWPSQRATCQPKAANFASRSPRSLVSLTQISDCSLLWSTMTVMLSMP